MSDLPPLTDDMIREILNDGGMHGVPFTWIAQMAREALELRAYRQPAGEDDFEERARGFICAPCAAQADGEGHTAVCEQRTEELTALLSTVRQRAIAGERERCAKVAEERAAALSKRAGIWRARRCEETAHAFEIEAECCEEIAAAIRSGEGE